MDQDEIIKLAVSYTKEHNKVYCAKKSNVVQTAKVYFEVKTKDDEFIVAADKVLGYNSRDIGAILKSKSYTNANIRQIAATQLPSGVTIYDVTVNGNTIPDYKPPQPQKPKIEEKDWISKFLKNLENFTEWNREQGLKNLGMTADEFDELADKKSKNRPSSKSNILNKNIGK
jgi:hypothetical protein